MERWKNLTCQEQLYITVVWTIQHKTTKLHIAPVLQHKKGGRYAVHAVAARLIGKYWHIHDPNCEKLFRIFEFNLEKIQATFKEVVLVRVLTPNGDGVSMDEPRTIEEL